MLSYNFKAYTLPNAQAKGRDGRGWLRRRRSTPPRPLECPVRHEFARVMRFVPHRIYNELLLLTALEQCGFSAYYRVHAAEPKTIPPYADCSSSSPASDSLSNARVELAQPFCAASLSQLGALADFPPAPHTAFVPKPTCMVFGPM